MINLMKTFDDIKQYDENNVEYWHARELQEVLSYSLWQNFHKVIKQAMISCQISQQEVTFHFQEIKKIIEMPVYKGKNRFIDVNKTICPQGQTTRNIVDYKITRYACYLIVMNGDPRKEIIALGQTYFAVKTRQQELQEIYDRLSEDEVRLFLRGDIKQKNLILAEAAHRAGIKTSLEYADFTNAGYKGLYGGLTALDIALHKNLKHGEEILDHMGSEELAANLFRITQTAAKIKRENIDTPIAATSAHNEVGKIVRKAIAEAGGTMPENLPLPDKSIKQLEQEQKQLLLDKDKRL